LNPLIGYKLIAVSVVVAELKDIAKDVGIDQKLLDDLSAKSSLQESPSTAMTLASECSMFSYMKYSYCIVFCRVSLGFIFLCNGTL